MVEVCGKFLVALFMTRAFTVSGLSVCPCAEACAIMAAAAPLATPVAMLVPLRMK